MADPTTTVKVDRNADFTYELDITSPVKDIVIRRGRRSEASQPPPGKCTLIINNSDGAYTSKGATTPLHPMHGVQVIADSQKLFTGFIRKPKLSPKGNKQRMKVTAYDWLWILSRIDISLPLMLNVRSDILAHRIADLAEIGEFVDNPRFKDDLTGWREAGGSHGTITRKTIGKIMEGPAAMLVECGSVNDGCDYDITADVSAFDDDVTVRAYIWADDDASIGNDVVMETRQMDNGVEKGALTGNTVTLTKEPQMVDLSGAHPFVVGGAIKFYMTLLAKTAGATNFRVGAATAKFTKNAIPRSFDKGQSIFSHIGPRRVNALRAIQEVANNELGGLVYVNGSGTLVFEDRYHRWRETASRVSQGTIDETMVDVPYEEDAEDLIGKVELHYTKWEEGATSTSSFGLYPVPRTIPANGTLTIDGDFGGRALMRDVIVPVANTDYKINREPGGEGVDASGSVTLAFEDFGGGIPGGVHVICGLPDLSD